MIVLIRHRLPLRRCFQFRLRTALFAMLIACLPLAWLSVKLERHRAAVAINRAGGSIWYLGPDAPTSPNWPYAVLPYDSQQPNGNALDRLIEDAAAGDVVAVNFSGGPVGGLLFSARGFLPMPAGGAFNFDGQEVVGDSTSRWRLRGNLHGPDGDAYYHVYDIVHYGNALSGAPLQPPNWRDLRAFPSLEVLALGDHAIGLNGLKHVGELDQLRCLLIYNGKEITDECLSSLGGLSKLRVLVIDKSQITDGGLAHLSGLKNPEVLELDGSSVRGGGLRHLAALQNLKLISLRETPLEDAGLAQLASLTGLQRLYFFRTRVTDAGLQHLSPLRELQILHLGKTDVTFGGANVFEKALGRSVVIR